MTKLIMDFEVKHLHSCDYVLGEDQEQTPYDC